MPAAVGCRTTTFFRQLSRTRMPIRAARGFLRSSLALLIAAPLAAQTPAPATDSAPDQVAQMVARLDLEHYKATIKGLTQFGDRRQGTERNRAAVDWIEAQLRSYGWRDGGALN